MKESLERDLGEAGIKARVEVRERLAILIPDDEADLTNEEKRRAALALATKHGFTHVALELLD